MKRSPAKIWKKGIPKETAAGVEDGARQRLDVTEMERRPAQIGSNKCKGGWGKVV